MTNSATNSYDVVIAGGGPAGTSAAIHLAMNNARVLLAEQKRFPREKLCGEFISPECLSHFKRLGVRHQMISSGGSSLKQTIFYSRSGRSVDIPSQWFGDHSAALGLSRAQMDNHLLERAKELGVCVVEDAYVSDLIMEGGGVRGIQVKLADGVRSFNAPVTIDATGRTRALVRRVDPKRRATRRRARPSLVAFKAHLEGARPDDGVCEIYSYWGGYGGLNRIEGDRSNLCFIASAKDVRRYASDPEAVLRQIVCKNRRAQYTLKNARAVSEWLGVSLETFGRQRPVPNEGLLTIGDAAAFIDPFTGSGMLMALESGELAARAIIAELENLKNEASPAALTNRYRTEYAKRFDSRLRVSFFLRQAAFVPRLAEVAIFLLGSSNRLRHRLARGTRGQQFREQM